MIEKTTDVQAKTKLWILLLIVAFLALTGINQSSLGASITSIAGNSYSGLIDGNRALGRLATPYDAVEDSAGNLYIANSNHSISKVASDGSKMTIAGTGVAGFADANSLAAQFNRPRGLVLDETNNILYIVDSNNHRIRKLDLNTNQVTTLVGDGTTSILRNPEHMVMDSAGNLYVSDANNHRIRMIDTSLTITTIAGGTRGYLDGNGTSARFNRPHGLAINSNDEIFIADRNNRRIRKLVNNSGTWQVTTVAGSGIQGATDGTALSAEFNQPLRLALDTSGNLYIVDHVNYKIRKLDTSNQVTTVAGIGQAGYADGDENTAVFSTMTGLKVLSDGTLMITDGGNHSIRKLDESSSYSAPEVETIAGRNSASFTNGTRGINRIRQTRAIVEGSDGSFYIADTGNHRIRKLAANGSVSTYAGTGVAGYLDGNAALAQFRNPWGLAIDGSDNLYVADAGNHRIRKIDTSGQVTTYAGSGSGFADGIASSAKFRAPHGICLDSSDNLYVADYSNHRIRMIDSLGQVTTLAGGAGGLTNGPSSISRLRNPNDIKINSQGELLIADYSNNAIRKLANDGSHWLLSTVAGGISAGFADGVDAQFNRPSGLAIDGNDNIYVTDRSNQRIRKITGSTTITVAGSGVRGFLDSSLLGSAFMDPEFITFDSTGKLLVSDTNNSRIRRLDLSNETSAASSSSNSSNLYVSTIGGALGVNGHRDAKASLSLFNRPYGMVTDSSGNLYVADRSNHLIRKIDKDGNSTSFAGVPRSAGSDDATAHSAKFNNPSDLVIDSLGNIYVADYSNHKIRKIDTSGNVTTFAGTGSAGNTDGLSGVAQFRNPIGLGIDSSDNLYVADYNNHRIRKITPSGLVSTVAGTSGGFTDGDISRARFNRPFDVAVDASGNLYVSDTNNHRIRKVSGSTVSTLAGAGTASFADGDSSHAQFYSPAYLAFNPSGDLVVADTNNNRIRKVSMNGNVTTISGQGLPGFKDGEVAEAIFNRPRGIAINSDGEIMISENSSRIRLISTKEPEEAETIIIQPDVFNHAPIVQLVSDIDLDANNSFQHEQGATLSLKAFAYDREDGLHVASSVTWVSDIQGQVASGLRFDASSLEAGTHNIFIKAIDSEQKLGSTVFTIEVIDSDDERVITPQADDSVLVQILMPKRNKKSRRSKRSKLRAVALELDDEGQIGADRSSSILWELDDEKVFLAEGPVLKMRKLPKGEHTIYARVGNQETSLSVRVGKRKVIFN